MTMQFIELAGRAAADGVISPEELLELRRLGWGDGSIAREEAEAIFRANRALKVRDEQWCDFFVEAIGEYVLNGTPPRLQCNDAEADWLIEQVDADGVVESMVELEALVRIIERAENVPDRLKAYILEQVEREVLEGTGPTRCGGELSATHINEAEVRILRRVIFASAGCGPAAVSRHDAELLFRLKDATLEDENAESWGDLFVDGIANYLRGFSHDGAQLSHERKLELVRSLSSEGRGFGGFLGEVMTQTLNPGGFGRNLRWAADHIRGTDGPQNDYLGDAAAGHDITDAERSWLESALERNGRLDDLEQRLLDRLTADEDY